MNPPHPYTLRPESYTASTGSHGVSSVSCPGAMTNAQKTRSGGSVLEPIKLCGAPQAAQAHNCLS